MRFQASRFATVLFGCVIVAISGCATQRVTVGGDGVVVVDKARFTIITPECIRIESSGSDGKFIDNSSLFAINRKARFTNYKLVQSGQQTVIETSAIQLTYKPDGKPLGETNLSAIIHKGSIHTDWKPGYANTRNLGGTVTTLDGADGAMDLGQGILSRDGWYLLDDSRGNLLTADWVESRPPSAGSDWYLFGYGDDYKAALKSLTVVSGPVPLPRKYVLGAWYSRYWPYTSADYRKIIREYATHDFPLDIMVMDMDWHTAGWTGWTWNRKLLPDYKALLADFHKQGLYVTLNTHPADGVATKEDVYAKFMRDMGQDPASGKTIPFDAGNKTYLDTLYANTHDPLTKDGVDFWWLDWQQDKFTRSISDLTNLAWLNRYYFNYTSRNSQRGVSFSRWAGWGDHRHPIHFSGDASTNWRMLAFEVPMTATAGNVGCFFWSHDIGGHQRGRNEESYTRWCQFGALSAALRPHSTQDPLLDRRPWTYPQWAEASMRRSFHLRSELFPYIYTSVAQSARETIPLTRPLYIDYPNDESAYHNGQEYLLGDNLLVAPITMPGVGPGRVGRQVVYFPEGTWYNLFSGERFEGPTEVLVSADINEMPLYVRGGVPIPMQPYSRRMTTAPLKTLRVQCFPGPDGKTVSSSLYEDDGVTTDYTQGQSATTSLSYARNGSEVTITIGPATGTFRGQVKNRDYSIELPNTDSPTGVTVNGKAVPYHHNKASKTTQILIPAQPISDTITIVSKFTTVETDNDSLRLSALCRRLSGVLGIPVNGNPSGQLALLSSKASDARTREAALAVCGIGLVEKNEAPYLFGDDNLNLVFYAPQGVIDKNTYQGIEKGASAAMSSAVLTSTGGNSIRKGGLSNDARRSGVVRFSIGSQQFTLPDNGDYISSIARNAKLSVNSTERDYRSEGLTDGVVDGYPDNKSAEWSSDQRVGASCTLTWDTPQKVNRIRLYDRVNPTDQVTSGILTFSDNSSLTVGALPEDRTPLEIKFSTKSITSVTFKVTGVKPKSEHAGLAEIEVFQASAAN